MKTEKNIPREKLFSQMEKDFKEFKVIYLKAPIGYGKTCAATEFLKKYDGNTASVCVGQENWKNICQSAIESGVQLLMIDDVQNLLTVYDGEQVLAMMAKASYQTRFLILGRCELPAWLRPFDLTGQLKEYSPDCLALDREEAKKLFALQKMSFSDQQITALLKKTKGWVLGTILLGKRIAKEQQISRQAEEAAYRDVFLLFDQMLFSKWEEKIQNFLLNIGGFDEFTEEMAQMVTGKAEVLPLLEQMQRIGGFLQVKSPGVYEIPAVFNAYLQWKQKIVFSAEKIREIQERAALYYTLKQEYPKALYYYYEAKNFSQIYELLLENAENHAGNGQFYELEKYYLAVPEELALKSPRMMSALSMLHSLCCRVEESERWFSRLEECYQAAPKEGALRREAQRELVYLKIALPHRGTANMIQLIKDTAPLISKKNIPTHQMSITGNMPSLMNGGKDFCEWSKHDALLYQTLRVPVELTLGKSSIGLADIGFGESLFEKTAGQKFAPALVKLNSGMAEAQIGGNDQLRFAAAAIISRIFAAQGNLEEAFYVEQTVCQSISEKTLQPNMQAFDLRMKLLRGGYREAAEWMSHEAPNEYETFHVIDRYCFLTKVRCYLLQEKHNEALALLGQLNHYFTAYHREYGRMEAGILGAIALYRMKDPAWQSIFEETLAKCAEYKFIRIVADEGAAVYEMLQKIKNFSDEKIMKKWREAAQRQALYYPLYLKPEKEKGRIPLTDAETTVLKLLVEGMKNEEIAAFLGITVRTVKFHITHIYHKLGVKNRASAIAMTRE